jgi:hypothetical protein
MPRIIIVLARCIHVVLLPLYFILHHYCVNFKGVSVADVAFLLAVHFCIIAFFLFLTMLFTRDLTRAVLFTTMIMLFLLFFGVVKETVFGIIHLPKTWQYVALIGAFGMGLWIINKLTRRKKIEAKVHVFLSTLFAIWILIEFLGAKDVYKKADTFSNPISHIPSGVQDKSSLYVLILDEYPRKDALEKIFGYDNSYFLQELQKRGFQVDSQSRSNYELTHISAASTLTLDYLPINGELKNEDYSIAAARFNRSPLWDLLKNEGYNIINYSIFKINDLVPLENSYTRNYHPEYFQRTLPGRLLQDYPNLFYSTSAIKAREERRLYLDRSYNEKRLKNIFSHIPGKRPEFVYMHLMMPHPPYFMDSTGNPIDMVRNKSAGNFIDYLKYSNKTVLSIIDKIKQLPGKKIIYIFGDHGFRSDNTPRELFFDNLSALYSNGGVKMQRGVTNVNQFRSIMNQALHQKFAPIKDTSIYLTRGKGHFNF